MAIRRVESDVMKLPKTFLPIFLLPVGLSFAYEPLEPLQSTPTPIDLTFVDPARQREIPVRLFLPSAEKPVPVLLFSHGLGGSRAGSQYLGEHWSSRGYAVVYLQHPGSDESVWQEVPARQRRQALANAASGRNYQLRNGDVRFVLDELSRRNQEGGLLENRLDLTRVGMSGHSFGAKTTQAVSGESFGRLGMIFTDPRISAAIPMSPSPPNRGDVNTAFQGVMIPWLLMTGTRDGSPIGGVTPSDRLQVYPALPTGGFYELVLHDAEHSAFSDRPLPGEQAPRNPNHHRVILASSTAFWDAYLLGSQEALAWLEGHGIHHILEPGDRWQWK